MSAIRRAKTRKGYPPRLPKQDHEVAALATSAFDPTQTIQDAGGSLRSIIDRFLPSEKGQVIYRAITNGMETGPGSLNSSRIGSDIVQSIVRTKKLLYRDGFRLRGIVKGEEQDQDMLEPFAWQHDLPSVVGSLIEYYACTDSMILFCKVSNGRLAYIQALSPADVELEDSTGDQTMMLRMSEEIVDRIREMPVSTKLEREARARAFPKKYLDAVERGDERVELRNADGEYWWVRTEAPKFTGLAWPSMRSIFTDIILHNLIRDGDLSVSMFVKAVILHLTAGEPNNAFPRKLYATTKELKAYDQQVIRNLGKAMGIATQHHVKMKYIQPDWGKLLSAERFEAVDDRIYQWSMLSRQLVTGKGGGYAQGTVAQRRLLADATNVRSAISSAFMAMLTHPEIASSLGLPKGTKIEVDWNWRNMKDPALALKELNAGLSAGTLDTRTYNEQLGFNHDIVLARKREDFKNAKVLRPVFEKSQGGLKAGEAGRPGNDQGVSLNDGPRASHGGDK